MSQNKRHSLVLRLGSTLGGIVLLSFTSMLSSIYITESISGMGGAINQSGSLRMQSYQIATDLVYRVTNKDDQSKEDPGFLFANYVQSFDSRLHHYKIRQAVPKDPDNNIHKAYQEVLRSWEYQIKPILYVYEKMGNPASYPSNRQESIEWQQLTEASRKNIRQRYMNLVSYFVAKIDHLVKELELEVDTQIRTLHIIESVSLFIISFIVLFSMIFVYTNILSPLQTLMTATETIRKGDLNFRAIVHGHNELSELANTFNAMTSELSRTYEDQENEIRRKTEDLKQKNSAMALLYSTSTILSINPTHTDSYEQILLNIKHFLNIDSGLICLSDSNADSGHILASTLQHRPCRTHCRECYSTESETGERATFSIRDHNQSFGLLILDTARESLEDWQLSTLRMISEQIGAAINIARNTIKEKENILNHERSSIARELHDSLAQSLSYLKIEVSRTQQEMQKDGVNQTTQEIVSGIRHELNNAYRQLRELLTTFRLSIETNELNDTFQSAVDDFRQRNSHEITLDIRLKGGRLNPHEAIHLIYILREALNNIQKHANASHVWIELRSSPSKLITLTIQDDGIGIDQNGQTAGHFGLAIMQERTTSLNGKFSIKERLGGGTIIEVTFTPVQHNNSSIQENITPWINQI